MHTARSFSALPAALLLATALSGCSRYDSRYAFEPRPAEITIVAPDVPGTTTARALASVIGIRRAAPEEGIGTAVEVRLRVDNVSGRSMRFDPSTVSLLSADLQQFPAPRLSPPGVVEVTPESPADVYALFPFPDDPSRPPMDLGGLNLRWTIEVEGRSVPGSITVRRRRYSPPPHWLHGWSFGYASHGHRGHRRHGPF